MLKAHPYQFVFSQAGRATEPSPVSVCISLYNYQQHITETLESVYRQTQADLDLIIVEDRSTDDSLAVAKAWLSQHAQRFNTVHLVQHEQNQGLSAARNTAIEISATLTLFILDADNLLYPRCIERCLEALAADPQAAMAYPIIEKFGEAQGLIGNVVWWRDRFKRNNCIDAMSLIRKQALTTVGGYSELEAVGKLGWEDYELWCKFIDQNLYGVPVPEILARYRTHKTSMLNSVSNQLGNIDRLHQEMMQLHPWLELPIG
ncbi:MAG: glycosyltransferase family 2 protein [Phormidesmis sp.]